MNEQSDLKGKTILTVAIVKLICEYSNKNSNTTVLNV